MHIRRLVIRNFRNFRHLDVELADGVTCIVGENNTGKTNLIHAIRLVLDASLSSTLRRLELEDFSAGVDASEPDQIVIAIEFTAFRGKDNEQALVQKWCISPDIARLTYRYRPKDAVIEALQDEDAEIGSLSIDDYRWQIIGGGKQDPMGLDWDEDITGGQSARFEELQEFLVVLLPPLRDVEQSLRQSRHSPLAKLLDPADIDANERAELLRVLKEANDEIQENETITRVGTSINDSFADAAGTAFRMDVRLGMAEPTFGQIARSLRVLLTNKAMESFDPSSNGLGLNNVLYISMLLQFFKKRMAKAKTAGQLLLVEEPEAHLHPQLQRVLFSTLQKENFQTIATTHSTHITSGVPFDSMVVLTDDGTSETSSTVPAKSSGLDATGLADLDRYLDATRSTLLYARKVMLVEGPAELFLIPALAQQIYDIDLDEYGISVIPIYGVHFDVYASLFGEDKIEKLCAIVTDGDQQPSDAIADDGNDDIDDEPERRDLSELQNKYVSVFMCDRTFEIELTDESTLPMLMRATKELGATRTAKALRSLLKKIKQGDQDALDEAKEKVLATAKRFGKARFAQLASKHVEHATDMPQYIYDAIQWLIEDETDQ